MSADRSGGEIDRHADGANAGACAQQAQPPGTQFEHVTGKYRHQRNGAAQKHREHVQRNGAEHDLLIAHVTEAGNQRLPALGLTAAALQWWRHQRDGDNRCYEKHHRRQVGHDWTKTVEKAAGHGTDNGRGLPGGGVPGNGVGQVAGRHQVGRQRLRGWRKKGARDADHQQHGEYRHR